MISQSNNFDTTCLIWLVRAISYTHTFSNCWMPVSVLVRKTEPRPCPPVWKLWGRVSGSGANWKWWKWNNNYDWCHSLNGSDTTLSEIYGFRKIYIFCILVKKTFSTTTTKFNNCSTIVDNNSTWKPFWCQPLPVLTSPIYMPIFIGLNNLSCYRWSREFVWK